MPHIDTVINPEIEVAKTIDRLMSFTGAVDAGEVVQRCRLLTERLNKTIALQGDGSHQELPEQGKIHDMDAVITITNDEENNIPASFPVQEMGS